MTETDDKLLKQFFNEQKHEIPDDGFSKRVMRNLPRDKKVSGIWISLCGIAAVILFFAMNGLVTLGNIIREALVSFVGIASTTSIDIRMAAILALALLIVCLNRVFSAE